MHSAAASLGLESQQVAPTTGGPPSLLDLCTTAVARSLPLPHVPFAGCSLPPHLASAIVTEYERIFGPLSGYSASGGENAGRLAGSAIAPMPGLGSVPGGSYPGAHPGMALMPGPYWHTAADRSAAFRWHGGPPGGLLQPLPPPSALQHGRWVALTKLASCWQPQALSLSLPAASEPQLPPLHLVSRDLLHLELSAPFVSGLSWVRQGFGALTCLSLAGCRSLTAEALLELRVLPKLRALCLRGLDQLGDDCGPPLSTLTQLVALDLSSTGVGDTVLDCLTYGHRLAAWSAASGAGPEQAAMVAAYGKTLVTRWHLSRTRVTPEGIQHLLSLPSLEFLDVRGTGMPRASLLPLERRFVLQQPQAAVLTRCAAFAAAAVGGGLFPCACPAVSVALPAVTRAAPGVHQGGGSSGQHVTAVAAAAASTARSCSVAAMWQAVAAAGGGGAAAAAADSSAAVVGLRRSRAVGPAEVLQDQSWDQMIARGILALIEA